MHNNFLTLIIAAVVLAAGIFALTVYKKSLSEDLVTKVEANLTEEQREMFEERIANLQAKIAAGNRGEEENLMMVYLDLGLNYEVLGELGLARDAYLMAAQENPKSSLPWGNLGTIYVQMSGNKLAKSVFEKAIKLEPALALNWQKWIEFNRYQLQAEDQKVRSLYQEAFEATSDDLNLHRQYARYLEEEEDYMGAIAAWQFLIDADPLDQGAIQEATRLRNQYLR